MVQCLHELRLRKANRSRSFVFVSVLQLELHRHVGRYCRRRSTSSKDLSFAPSCHHQDSQRQENRQHWYSAKSARAETIRRSSCHARRVLLGVLNGPRFLDLVSELVDFGFEEVNLFIVLQIDVSLVGQFLLTGKIRSVGGHCNGI